MNLGKTMKLIGKNADTRGLLTTLEDIDRKLLKSDDRVTRVGALVNQAVYKMEIILQHAIEKAQLDSEKDLTLKYRLTQPYKSSTHHQNIVVPELDAFSFETYLVAVQNVQTDVQFNFVFSNGAASKLTASRPLNELRIEPVGIQIRKVIIWYRESDGLLFGVSLFDSSGSKILETKRSFNEFKSQETILEENERIIGIKSRKDNEF